MVDGTVVRGELSVSYTGMAALDAAGPQDISFLGNERYRPLFHATKAGAVLVSAGERGAPEEVALIEVENPSAAFSIVVKHFAKARRPFKPGIHPRACVDESAAIDAEYVSVHAGAVIGANASIGHHTEIGANVVIGDGVKIGRDCVIYPNVTIREGCIIGDRVILQPGAVIGSDGYGYEFIEGRHMKIDQVGIVEIANDVEIGANTTIDRARFGKTVIGEGTKIDNLVQIGHNVVIGKHCLIIAQTGMAGSSKLHDYVTVAAQVGVVGHVEVGPRAMLAARTGVTTSLSGGETYMGVPAQPMRDEQKLRVHIRRLPKLVEEVKQLKAKLNGE